VRGGLSKQQIDLLWILKTAGWTARDFRRLEMVGSLTEAERKTWFKHIPAQIDAGERASDRELRRIVRARERTKLMADLRVWLESNMTGAPPGRIDRCMRTSANFRPSRARRRSRGLLRVSGEAPDEVRCPLAVERTTNEIADRGDQTGDVATSSPSGVAGSVQLDPRLELST
jgi:hypothetical protein